MSIDDIKYRIFPDGTIVHQDDFEEIDNSTPVYDDYSEHSIPEILVEHIIESV